MFFGKAGGEFVIWQIISAITLTRTLKMLGNMRYTLKIVSIYRALITESI